MELEKRIAGLLVTALELDDYDADSLPADALLFGPEEAGGLELDSLAALEVIAVLSEHFKHDFQDVSRDDLMTLQTIADCVRRKGLAA